MKINKLEAHDRLIHLKNDQSINVALGIEECLKKNPLSLAMQELSPYIYIFAHPRTADDGITKRMLYQPRLTKPKAQTNSYLFRAKSHSDIVEVCWLIPPREMWEQYKKGKVTEHLETEWSINMFTSNREKLEEIDPEDFSDEKIREIYRYLSRQKVEKDFTLKPSQDLTQEP